MEKITCILFQCIK